MIQRPPRLSAVFLIPAPNMTSMLDARFGSPPMAWCLNHERPGWEGPSAWRDGIGAWGFNDGSARNSKWIGALVLVRDRTPVQMGLWIATASMPLLDMPKLQPMYTLRQAVQLSKRFEAAHLGQAVFINDNGKEVPWASE